MASVFVGERHTTQRHYYWSSCATAPPAQVTWEGPPTYNTNRKPPPCAARACLDKDRHPGGRPSTQCRQKFPRPRFSGLPSGSPLSEVAFAGSLVKGTAGGGVTTFDGICRMAPGSSVRCSAIFFWCCFPSQCRIRVPRQPQLHKGAHVPKESIGGLRLQRVVESNVAKIYSVGSCYKQCQRCLVKLKRG